MLDLNLTALSLKVSYIIVLSEIHCLASYRSDG